MAYGGYEPINSLAADWSIFFESGETGGRELVRIDGDDLDQTRLIWECIVVSLFSDGRAPPESVIDGRAGGWWGAVVGPDGDTSWGSLIWLYESDPATVETALKVRDAARDSLAWLVRDNHAEAVEVDAGAEGEAIWLTIAVTRGSKIEVQFADLWKLLEVIDGA